MKCGGEEENNHVHKCPLCSTQRDDIHALKYHIRKEHNKNKRGNVICTQSMNRHQLRTLPKYIRS